MTDVSGAENAQAKQGQVSRLDYLVAGVTQRVKGKDSQMPEPIACIETVQDGA